MFYKEITNDNELEIYQQEAVAHINIKFPLGFLEQGIIYEFYRRLVNLVNFFFGRGE